jgi:hypothetical protein
MEKDKQVSVRHGNTVDTSTGNQEHYFLLSVMLGLTHPIGTLASILH